jgi:glycosyltransferase involved in cell wall biosynthesis
MNLAEPFGNSRVAGRSQPGVALAPHGPRVIIASGVFEPGFRGGGPVRSLAHIIDGAPSDLEVLVITRDRDLNATRSYDGLSGRWVQRKHARVFYLNTRRPGHWCRLVRGLRRRPVSLLYLNSVWDPCFTVIPILLTLTPIVRTTHVVIAPRGEFSAGALEIKSRKKRWFLELWRPVLTRLGIVWHATTDQEAEDIRAVFPVAQIEVCPEPSSAVLDLSAVPAGGVCGRRRFVFIGRVARIKNLRVALEALAAVSTPVMFDVYGPLEDRRYWAECQRVIAKLPDHVSVCYQGELDPAAVVRTFAAYDAFVLPTLGENFGHVISESLAAQCPVICSDKTSWTPVLKAGGGEVVDNPTPVSLGRVLDRWAAMTNEEIGQARAAAAVAYHAWQSQQPGTNVLEQLMRRFQGGH